MDKIYTSATKLVFLLTAVTVSAGFFMDKIPVEQFMPLAMVIFSFYYSKKGEVKPTELG